MGIMSEIDLYAMNGTMYNLAVPRNARLITDTLDIKINRLEAEVKLLRNETDLRLGSDGLIHEAKKGKKESDSIGELGTQIQRLEELNSKLINLVQSVGYEGFYICCNDTDEMNWFDARDDIVKEGGES